MGALKIEIQQMKQGDCNSVSLGMHVFLLHYFCLLHSCVSFHQVSFILTTIFPAVDNPAILSIIPFLASN